MFCRQETTTGRVAPLSPAHVARELPGMIGPGRGGEAAFYGGSFTLLPASVQEAYLLAARPYLRNGALAGIRISTRPDALDEERLAFLKAHGVSTIEIGCQSFAGEVLLRAGRGYAPEVAARAVARVRRFGIRVGIQLMPGLPGGGRDEALASLNRALRLAPDFLRIYPTLVLRDTRLAEAYAAGAYLPLSLEDAVALCGEMLWRCRHHAVPVIRLGLQGTLELESEAGVVAGPWHPAFGQLVRSRLWLRALQSLARTGVREVFVPAADLADALGHKRDNLPRLRAEYPRLTLRGAPGMVRETLRSAQQSWTLQELSAYPMEESRI